MVEISRTTFQAAQLRAKTFWIFVRATATPKLIAVYVEQHNSVVPHSAFAGQTPDEMYFGRGDQVPVVLAAGRACAREARMKSNRELSRGS
jgi:putative transposase